MSNPPSVISKAEDAALDLTLTVRRAMADQVITPAEAEEIRRSAGIVHQRVRRAHRAQRASTSVLRTGRIVTQIYREFGADDGEEELREAV